METENKERPIVIIIYGMVAVGKLTVAKALQAKVGYRLTHNHLINDLVWSIYDRGTYESNALIERLRYELYEDAIRNSMSVIITHAYSHDYVSPTGLTDPEYLQTLEEKLETAGAKTLFVQLVADEDSIIERVQGESRRDFKKLTDPLKLREYLDSKTESSTMSPQVRDNLRINNTNLTPEEVVERIMREIARF